MPDIYTVEIDGKVYEIEGDRPPTEAEARAAIQSYQPPPPSSTLAGQMLDPGPPVITETGADATQSEPDSWIGGFLGSLKDQIKGAFGGARPMLEDAAFPSDLGDLMVAPTPIAGSGGAAVTKAISGGARAIGKGATNLAAGAGDLVHPDLIGAVSPRLGNAVKLAQKIRGAVPPTTTAENLGGKLAGKSSDPLADMLRTVRGELDNSPITEVIPTRTPPHASDLPEGGIIKDASGKPLYTSDYKAGRHDIPLRNKPTSPLPPESRLVRERRNTLEEELMRALQEGRAEYESKPLVSAWGDKGYRPPSESPIPAGGRVRNAAGTKVYTSDVQSGRHDIPARDIPEPLPSHPSTLEDELVRAVEPSAPPSIPPVRVKSWKPGKGPQEDTIKLLRNELGSRDAAKKLAIPQEEVKKVGGISRLPDAIRRTIDARLSSLKTAAEKQAYLDAAPNQMAKDYILSKLR